MSDVHEKLRVERARCPWCHDDIVPGGKNRACSECLTWHHTECWESHGKCVGCGNEWVSEGGGSYTRPAEKKSNDCVVHAPANADSINDLTLLYGMDIWNQCTCDPAPIMPGEADTAVLDLLSRDLTDIRYAAGVAQTKEHEAIRRADAGPKVEPPCAHQFSPMDYRCVFCHKDSMEHAREVFGSTYIGARDVRETIKRHHRRLLPREKEVADDLQNRNSETPESARFLEGKTLVALIVVALILLALQVATGG